MYLLNTSTFQLHRFIGDKVPPYVILSHTWGDGEVLFQDIEKPASHYQQLKGFSKVDKCCALARSDGWEYVWIDNCCIDQKSSAELSEAINSMYRWYKDAEVCYAYLADISVSVGNPDSPRTLLYLSRWFTRGWTLQELLAPFLVIFFDRDWIDVGTKHSLGGVISDATGIDTDHLFNPRPASAAAKMSWASRRKTTRPEDIAYCLLGLFDVNMPLLYGEGATKAFERLQHEIIRSGDDESIFAWLMPRSYSVHSRLDYGGMLAPSPEYFFGSGDIVCLELPNSDGPRVTLSSFGISMALSFTTDDRCYQQQKEAEYDYPSPVITAALACTDREHKSSALELRLRKLTPQKIARLLPWRFEYTDKEGLGFLDMGTFHVNYRFEDESRAILAECSVMCPSTLTFRLSLEAQKRLSFGGSTSEGDDGRLTVTAATPSIVNFQHAGGFMVRFRADSFRLLFIHIEREFLNAHDTQWLSLGFGESVSVPLRDEEVLWLSWKYGCNSNGKLVIVDMDITFKDKVDRESILWNRNLGSEWWRN